VAGAVLTPVLVTGSAPVPAGGTLTSGTYHLTRSEIVLREGASTDAMVECTGYAQSTRQETLRLEANSPTDGEVVAAARENEPTGVAIENGASGTYSIAGTALTLTLQGTSCDTTISPLLDGGTATTVVPSDANTTPLVRQFTGTETTLAFVELALGSVEAPECWAVSTYTKQ